ncbi:hypothetical protein [Pseudomonas huaxiensis]|nr:hypothetical protein [Pseudomonas huaxiensis]
MTLTPLPFAQKQKGALPLRPEKQGKQHGAFVVNGAIDVDCLMSR